MAFGASEIVVVGKRDVNMHHGDKGAQRQMKFVHFFSIADAAKYLKEERGCSILGVEITDDAAAIQTHPFTTSTAFIFGNEALGLSDRQRAVCDAFTYIPQHSQQGQMGSINVACASAVVLHHFALWAQFQESPRSGSKFTAAPSPGTNGNPPTG